MYDIGIIGGGPAGMEAARVCAECGYDVSLCEKSALGGLLDFAEAEAVHLRPDTVEAARGAESPQIVALSTCSSEYTDARTIVLAYMTPYTTETQVGG